MAPSQESLSTYQQGNPVRFYDEECALDIDPDKARGYLILLGSYSNPTLAFTAITDGNLVDAFMGAPPQKRDNAKYYAARDAKLRMATASDTSESIKELSILSYKQALEVVVEHHKRVKKVLICCRCFVQRRFRKKSKTQLREIFGTLEEAVSNSTR